ncbi:MAG: ketoacyl-ACP synthase III [Prolixibacteraceae bacterium]|jgi:3-oxoacyl-[acyl-carrier-protein] synthase-3|nr:ketoacyl-ACP synthase III [Prolixibacteraceae bacterium]
MSKNIYTTIIGSGSYIPELLMTNDDFLNHEFYDPKDNKKFEKTNEEIIEKFKVITNIDERRWAKEDQMTSDLGALAAKDALESSGIDPDSLEFIIVGHNFGDIAHGTNRSMLIPNLAARVKQHLNIKKPSIVAFDIVSGCPSWVQAMIVANSFIKSGIYKRGLVVGADVNSRVGDPHDRDCMIFADGAGAVIVEATESETPVGILSHAERTDAVDWAEILIQGPSIKPDTDETFRYINMQGPKVYIYAIQNVPGIAKEALDKAGIELGDINKVLIHQANQKLDEAICQRLMRLYKMKGSSKDIMPMTINKLGNTSAATIPTMYDLIKKGKMEGHEIKSGDNLIFTSVGAGMQINAVIYKEL